MTSIWDRSATVSSNNSSPPAGFPEDQAPSLVDDQFRAEMAYQTEFVHSVAAAGTADALTVTYTNVPASLTDGMEIHVRAANANATTTPTINVNSLGAKTITKAGGSALLAGDIAGANHELILRYNSSASHFELLNPATATSTLPVAGGGTGDTSLTAYAVLCGGTTSTGAVQSIAGVGTSGQVLTSNGASALPTFQAATGGISNPSGLNVKITRLTTTSLTVTYDQVSEATALGGNYYPSFSGNFTLNGGATGANGLDTGTLSASSYYAIYAITKGDGSTFAVLAYKLGTLATIYPGANMPSGYTASALLGIWPTNASAQFSNGIVFGREFYYSGAWPQPLSNVAPTTANTLQSLSIGSGIPAGAISVSGMLALHDNSGAGTRAVVISPDTGGTGAFFGSMAATAAGNALLSSTDMAVSFAIPVMSSQTLYWTSSTISTGFDLYISGFGW